MIDQKQALFKDLIEHTQDLILCVDSEGKFIFANQTWLKKLNYSSQDINNITWWDVIHPDEITYSKAHFEQLLNAKTIDEIKITFLTKNGSLLLAEGKLSGKFDQKKQLMYIRGIFREVKVLQTVEQKHISKEEVFEKMLSLVPDMISIHDPEMNIVYSNWEGFGAVPEEKKKLYSKCYKTYRGLDEICPDCEAVKVLDTKEAFQKEVELQEGIWVDLRVIPLLGTDGSVEFFVEWVRDITKQKQEERDKENLIENSPDMIIRFNTAQEIIYCNDATERYLGLSKHYFIGKTLLDLGGSMGKGAAKALKIWNDTLQQCLAKKEEQQQDLSFQLVSEEKYFSTQVVPEFNSLRQVESLLTVTRDITDRMNAVFALKAQEEKMRTTLGSIGDAVIATCTAGLVTLMNPVAEELTGWSNQEAIGKPLEEVFPIVNSQTLKTVENPVKQVLRTGKVVGLANHTMLLCRDGSEYQIADSASPIRDDQGKISGVVLVFRDVTYEYQLQQELKSSEQRLNTLISQTPAVIYSFKHLNNLPKITYVNDNIKNILGFEPEEYTQNFEFFKNSLHPDDAPRVIAQFSTLKAEKQLFQKEFRLKDKQGYYRWLHDEQKLIINEDGTKEVIGAWWDITERKQMEQVLRENENLLNSVFDSIQDGICVLSKDLVIRQNNKALQKWYQSSESLLGKKCYEVFQKSNQPCDPCPALKAMQTKSMQREIVAIAEQTDQQVQWIESFSYPLRGSEEEVVGAVEFIRDVTEIKKQEQEIKASKLKLEELHQITLKIRMAKTEAEIIELLYQAAQKTLKLNYCAVAIREGDYFVTKIKSKQNLPGFKEKSHYKKGLAGIAYQKGQTIVNQEITSTFYDLATEKGFTAVISSPLGKLGIFQGASKEKDAFKGEISNLLEILTSHTAEAIQRVRFEKDLHFLSFHDNLTGLYNRYYLEEEMKRLDTIRQLPLGIIMIDLNGLKLINDTYGHAKGDVVLKSLADILKNTCRKEELIARWGGDEFILLLPQTNTEEVKKLSQRIIQAFKGVLVEGIPISIAIGTAQKDTMDKPLNKVLNEAEDQMYKSKLQESKSARSSVLNALLNVLAAKSFETEAHSLRMRKVALQIGQDLNLPETELNRLSLLTTLHDIGKVNISEEILTRNSSLTDEEWEIVKKHPEIGYRIARATEEFAHVAEDILTHHERWDGSGYPSKLKGKEIPLLARIVCIADAYEVMTSGRPYKKAMSKNQIIEEFEKCSGTQFDPELVTLFLASLDS